MKKLLIIAALLAFAAGSRAQTTNPQYDAELAKKLGADDYGMKAYVLVILKTGPAKIADKDKLQALFRGHMANIQRLADAGTLVVAGPLGKNEQAYRGIFIFDVKTVAEAKELVLTDPAVKEQVFDAEFFEWYGSAALPEYLKAHGKIEKLKP
ncbi:MAG TPA: YciI family protein [Sphingobacteriaceae bacterium]